MVKIFVPNESIKKCFSLPTSNELEFLNRIEKLSIEEGYFVTTAFDRDSSLAYFNIVNYHDLPSGIMEDYIPPGNIFYCCMRLKSDGSMIWFYMHPQVDKKIPAHIDIYCESIEGFEKEFDSVDERDRSSVGLFAFKLIYHIEKRMRKEPHRIKRIMPKPEQKELADKSGKPYETQPIIIKDISVQYIYEPHEMRKYARHCEAWNVRGHYRHYKSGKVVYIRPHTKGKGTLKNTTYVFQQMGGD